MRPFLRHVALGLLVAGAAICARVRPGDAPAAPEAPAADTARAPADSGAPRETGGPASPGPVVHLNRAGPEELESLPGIGPVLARRILEFRARRGPFRDAGEVRLVRGIGPKKWARIRPFVAP